MRPVSVFGLGLALAAAFAPPHATAAGEKLKLGVFGAGKGSGPLLTKAELRECLALQERMKSGGESAAREREGLDKEKAELIRQGEELKVQLETLDRTSVEAIEAYRARALARDKAIDAFEARSTEFNARLGALGGERASFGQRCDNRRFDELDEIAIRNGK